MAEDTKESGLIITWRVWASTSGMMGECIKASTRTIRNMATAFTHGLMDVATKDIGLEVSSTAWVHISCQKKKK